MSIKALSCECGNFRRNLLNQHEARELYVDHSAFCLQVFLVSERALGTDNAGEHEHEHVHAHAGTHSQTPIGVMGDHMLHKKGEWMLSFRYMYMDMGGNRIGTDRVSSDFIVQNVPNRFFGMPMQPPTLRIVPTEMTMDMVMFGAMWAA